MTTELDRRLCQALRDHPSKFGHRYTSTAQGSILDILFRSLTADKPQYLGVLFPNGFPDSYSLQEAQGVNKCTEYTEAARGRPCGHILKQGEASYHCMTCTDDATCVLCARCFDSSDHEGHQFHISPSQGNSGCCDCGDLEAWKKPVNCAIHTARQDTIEPESRSSPLPLDLVTAIRITIGRVLDYFCDVISCSPENLRHPKTVDAIKHDESYSRLGSKWYCGGDEFDSEPEYCLVLWNDEKHTVQEVRDQVARACHEREKFGLAKANEANDIGRTVIKHSRNLEELLRISSVIEQIKVTVTIRSSRDTFREQMCGTIVEWLSDIAGCSIGDDHQILRYTICQEMLQQWRIGSEAYNAKIGKNGIDDHARTDKRVAFNIFPNALAFARQAGLAMEESDDEEMDDIVRGGDPDEDADDDDEEDDDDDESPFIREVDDGEMDMDLNHATDAADVIERVASEVARATDMGPDGDMGEAAGTTEAAVAGYPPPPPPPPRPPTQQDANAFTPTESDFGEGIPPEHQARNFRTIPRTPRVKSGIKTSDAKQPVQPSHWGIKPAGYTMDRTDVPAHEDLTKNIRLDSMILFDLRLWKKTRIDLRDLYISTVVNVPQFKRILGLRFSGLYTTLSQLYLVADREPDHSIINLSLQMLTSPSITEEVIERGNFLTNLMAILYTFLTTRQVGFPEDVSSAATLVFDAGSVTNRRLYHFFADLRYFLSSEYVQRRVRIEKQYLLQYLDLAKLSQGICPNVRAVGDHVEYETDAWISASLLTREIDKLCRQFAESFRGQAKEDAENTYQAISTTALVTIINSVGLERKRFDQCEIKEITKFKLLRPYDFENNAGIRPPKSHRVVDFVVEKGAISFHHALHYTLSWLIECARGSTRTGIILKDAASHFNKSYRDELPTKASFSHPDDALLAMFDFPLRVCAWLAQMKASMWVRNGMSLRHQMGQYKGVTFRDVGHHRDIFLLQTALIVCEPERILASMIDRYGLDDWMRGNFSSPSGWEDSQTIEVAEDLIYLLIVLLSDRAALITVEDEPNPQLVAVRKDIIHTLCFKPLSFSDLSARLTERAQDYPELQEVLETMTNFRAPEGLHDTGMFELKLEFLEELDPYNTNYNKNQRDEAENIYRNWMAKKLNKPAADVVLEPKLRHIPSGLFKPLPAFTSKPLFAQVVYYALGYALQAKSKVPEIPVTRVEAFLHVVLQLALIATLEDDTNEDDCTEESMESFVRHALTLSARNPISGHATIISLLQKISNMDEFVSCKAKIKHMLRLFVRKRQRDFHHVTSHLDFPYGRLDTASPANVESEIEAKKKQALERKAKVMAQFQQQQQKFMDNQGMVDWGEDDFGEHETEIPTSTEKKQWKYPTGVCIQCREEMNDSRIYGTFAMIIESNVLRQTDMNDPDWIRESLDTPKSMDRSAESVRPFGLSGENHDQIRRLTSDGKEIITDRQGLGKGWPKQQTMTGAVSSGCGHIMHYACFENYYSSIHRRQNHQVARHHPERLGHKEFVCPLCKALGNTFLPIIWKGTEESYPGKLAVDAPLDHFLDSEMAAKLEMQKNQVDKNEQAVMRLHLDTLGSFSKGQFVPEIRAGADGSASPFGLLMEKGSFPELSRIYIRLRETLSIVKASQQSTTGLLNRYDMLVESLGCTISATEIAHRGLASEPGFTLLDRIAQQTLTHLRIVSDTTSSYAAMASMSTPSNPESDFRSHEKRLFRQLFFTSAKQDIAMSSGLHRSKPLFLEDTFVFLTQCSLALCPVLNLELHHVLHLCYIAEIVKVVLMYMFNPNLISLAELQRLKPENARQAEPTASDLYAVSALVDWIRTELLAPYNTPKATSAQTPIDIRIPPENNYPALYRLACNYALPFLRKSIILFNVSHGVDFPSTGIADFDVPEIDRLTRLLRLPSINSILTTFSQYSGPSSLKVLVAGWLHHLVICSYLPNRMPGSSEYHTVLRSNPPGKPQQALTLSLNLLHPCPLELIGLPKYYDVLMEETHRRKCPTTGKELTDPSLCLFCGDIFCSQAICCMNGGKRGGCNLHVEKCSKPIGLFLNIRKCMILFLHVVPALREGRVEPLPAKSNGSWFPAPYLTKHGEIDPGLRQRHQLILNQRRYDRILRDAWLMVNATIWSAVARKLEGEVNGGGWETI